MTSMNICMEEKAEELLFGKIRKTNVRWEFFFVFCNVPFVEIKIIVNATVNIFIFFQN